MRGLPHGSGRNATVREARRAGRRRAKKRKVRNRPHPCETKLSYDL